MSDNTDQPLTPLRKCCNTPRGKGQHLSCCPNGVAPRRSSPPLRETFDKGGIPKSVRREILDEVYGDLPDGAYLAVAEEMGLNPEDLVEG